MIKNKIAIITAGVLLSQCVPAVAQDLNTEVAKSNPVVSGKIDLGVTTGAGVVIDTDNSSSNVDKPNSSKDEHSTEDDVNSTTSAGVSVVDVVTEKAQAWLNTLYVDNSFPLYYGVVAKELEAIEYGVEVLVKVIDFDFEQSTYDVEGFVTYTLQLDSPEGLNTATVSRVIPVKEKPSRGSGGGSSSGGGSGDNTETEVVPDDNSDVNQDIVSDMEVKLPNGEVVTVPKNGTVWVKDSLGAWYHFNNGTKTTGWLQDNGTWYLLSSTGAMTTGWYLDSSNVWYFLNRDGSMKTGWHLDATGKWYYLNSNGSMASSTYVNGYYVDSTGVWIK
jgi:hypothetical protein